LVNTHLLGLRLTDISVVGLQLLGLPLLGFRQLLIDPRVLG
jgi:hypothetical protein